MPLPLEHVVMGGKPRPQWGKSPKKYISGSTQKKPCMSCGEEVCPRCCFNCKERGHLAARCLRKRAGSKEDLASAPQLLLAATGSGQAGPGAELAADLLWYADSSPFSMCGEPGAARSVSSSTRSAKAAALSGARVSLFPANSKLKLGMHNVPTLADTGFSNRSNCAAIMSYKLFNSFFANDVPLEYPHVLVSAADEGMIEIIATFKARLQVPADKGPVRKDDNKVFTIGLVNNFVKALLIGTQVLDQLRIGVNPGCPGQLSLYGPRGPQDVSQWQIQRTISDYTSIPATKAGWDHMDPSFWGSPRRSWGGGEFGVTKI